MKQPAITLEGPDLRSVANGVLAMMLPPRLRRLWLSRMGRMVIAQAKKNVADQKTVSGSPMAPRKRKPPEKRPVYHRGGGITAKRTHNQMLFDLVRAKFLRVEKTSEEEARIGFTGNAGMVAFKHQHGISEKFIRKSVGTLFTKEEMTPGSKESYHKVNRTAALELMKCGVKQPIAEIERTWTVFQASIYLTKMKTGWTVQIPARPFLGVDEEQKLAMGETIMNGIYDRFKAKNHSGLLK